MTKNEKTFTKGNVKVGQIWEWESHTGRRAIFLILSFRNGGYGIRVLSIFDTKAGKIGNVLKFGFSVSRGYYLLKDTD